MTGPDLAAVRHRLGLSTTQLGRAFGYTGSDVTSSGTIRKYESGNRPIPPWLARLAVMFDRYGVPEGWTNFNEGLSMQDEKNPAYAAAAEHLERMSRHGLYEGETIDIRPCAGDSDTVGGYEVVQRRDGKIEDIITFDKNGQQVW